MVTLVYERIVLAALDERQTATPGRPNLKNNRPLAPGHSQCRASLGPLPRLCHLHSQGPQWSRI